MDRIIFKKVMLSESCLSLLIYLVWYTFAYARARNLPLTLFFFIIGQTGKEVNMKVMTASVLKHFS